MTSYSDRINGTEASVAIKAPCAIATLANITLSGLQTIDGVAIAAGVRVLVRAQTDARQNGIWVSSTSAWSRATDFNGARDVVQGTSVYVWGGNSFATGQFVLTTANPVIGVSELSFIYGWVQSNPLVLRGDWAAGTSYLINNAVFDPITGASYYAKTNHTSGSTFASDIALWQKYAARGAPGAGTGDVVGANNGAEFANKAVTLSTLGGQPVDAALTSLAGLSLVAGDLLYATGADTVVRLAKGTASQQLRMNSGATAPEWVTPTAVSGFDLLGTITTTSGATATLSGLTLTGYKFLRLVLNGVSTNNAGNLTLNSVVFNASATAGEATSGFIEVDLTSGVFSAATGRGAAGAGSSGGGASGLTTASTSVTIGAGGNTFDAGSVRVYGVV